MAAVKLDLLENLRIVLVGTTHPGNIGAAARAMKNMGLGQLVLVDPKKFPAAEATARASGADGILAAAQVCDSLAAAVADCGLVVGASARERAISWPVLSPRALSAQALDWANRGSVAVVFGREHSGLTNEELERCNRVVTIPTQPGFSSLNVAAAVQIITYELRLATLESAPEIKQQGVLATAEQLALLYQHLEQTMCDVGFYDPEKPRHLMRRLKRLFGRAELAQDEAQILRGFLAAVQASQKENR